MIKSIHGLKYIQNYITDDDHRNILNSIDGEQWSGELKRRVQHYGYKYDYRSRSINQKMFLGPLPEWCSQISKRLFDDNLMPQIPDQLIVNEYNPGQGIASHVDCQPCFGNTVVSLSLNSGVIMELKSAISKRKVDIWLEPKSVVILSGESRYWWIHGIVPRKSDIINHERKMRERRISLTFRKVII